MGAAAAVIAMVVYILIVVAVCAVVVLAVRSLVRYLNSHKKKDGGKHAQEDRKITLHDL